MSLLNDEWIPVRPLNGGKSQVISLKRLLCRGEQWTLALPRDDMELAALQLITCMVQVIFLPGNEETLRKRLSEDLSEAEYDNAVTPWEEKFQLDHPEHPFMQTRGVKAKDITAMDKLLTGVTGATNCVFVNEPGQGEALCPGCTAIALFNQANNAPGFGGGFKSGLRGGAPVTTLVQAIDLRTTVWLNVLTKPNLEKLFGQPVDVKQPPVWFAPVKSGEEISAARIGLVRGLFWQPAHIELSPPVGEGICSACGHSASRRYNGFFKEKFNFTIKGLWPHPHSPRLLQTKKGIVEEKFLAFTTAAPAWSSLSSILISKQLNDVKKDKEGCRRAAVIEQYADYFIGHQLALTVGGYRNNQASILGRRHEVLQFNSGWDVHLDIIENIVSVGQGYRMAIRKALYIFCEGIKAKDIKGAGVPVYEPAERQYYRRSDDLIITTLSSIDFTAPSTAMTILHEKLQIICRELFAEFTRPYLHHPKLVRITAIARRNLDNSLAELLPQGGSRNVA
ncbi:type I-E CRISPR-associated protein Cse1/CasA [Cronobacter dublinensis]|nr:type I-E CRISPR-associated protein Cse1/CasA [Cronobacter dublinensis]ELY3969588.1 type I-E CRISPR-associated protein Cse1/CasA [Cronobacter dublinensis]ELY4486206.1 type I-E CRISPR-associated protein Cse1/CasA [Cronobacter dublinensis]ELY5824207.1 type I-E CRISPR-associated protein Cse1/CasA [Cronobacter dublinensis]